MHNIADLDRYPLDQPQSSAYDALVAQCRMLLARDGLFNLPGFMTAPALSKAVDDVLPVFDTASFTHARRHNIYFKKSIDGLPADHPALRTFETSHKTICADQIPQSVVMRLYEWPPFIAFLARVLDKQDLYAMADPLARVNVMRYGADQALNWHFDRSEFTTTLLLQAPDAGGAFEYAKDLRAEGDPNYAGVADLLEGRLDPVQMPVTAGTLNIFKGKNTAHRVTPVRGETARVIAVFSYFETPDVQFSDTDRIGFYGRAS